MSWCGVCLWLRWRVLWICEVVVGWWRKSDGLLGLWSCLFEVGGVWFELVCELLCN